MDAPLGNTGAIAERQPTSAAATPKTPASNAPVLDHQPSPLGHAAPSGGRARTRSGMAGKSIGAISGDGLSAARTTSGVNGGWRKRTPVASKIALAMAA